MGDVVSVKPGYARNYLLPQRKARRATKENLALFEKHRAQLEAENLTRRDEAQKVGEKLDGLAVTLIRQAGESGQLYGSVTSRDLAEAATAAGFTVARTQILLDMVIKTLGLHTIRVRLHPEVTVTVTANVARSDAEAEAQAKSGHIVSAEEREAVAAAAASAKEAALSALEVDQAEADEADAGEAEDSAKGE
jgi:large subunit ribosomal protein L9